MGKRKGKRWGPGNPLWEWRKRKGLLGKWSKPSSGGTKKKRRTSPVARKHRRRKGGFTIPIAVVSPLVAIPFVPAKQGWSSPLQDALKGNWNAVGAAMVNGFNPFVEVETNGQLKFGLHLPNYLAMLVGGYAAHWIAGKMGINRALGRAKIPVIRV